MGVLTPARIAMLKCEVKDSVSLKRKMAFLNGELSSTGSLCVLLKTQSMHMSN